MATGSESLIHSQISRFVRHQLANIRPNAATMPNAETRAISVNLIPTASPVAVGSNIKNAGSTNAHIKTRNEALSAERDAASHQAIAATLTQTNQEIKVVLQQLLTAQPSVEQRELLNVIAAKFVSLSGGVAQLIRSTVPHV